MSVPEERRAGLWACSPRFLPGRHAHMGQQITPHSLLWAPPLQPWVPLLVSLARRSCSAPSTSVISRQRAEIRGPAFVTPTMTLQRPSLLLVFFQSKAYDVPAWFQGHVASKTSPFYRLFSEGWRSPSFMRCLVVPIERKQPSPACLRVPTLRRERTRMPAGHCGFPSSLDCSE